MVKKWPFALFCAIPLSGCAAGAATEPSPPPMAAGCDAQAVQPYLGAAATAELGDRLLRLTGARRLRWGPPDAAMTMDFRPDRLTVSYDRDMAITRIACG